MRPSLLSYQLLFFMKNNTIFFQFYQNWFINFFHHSMQGLSDYKEWLSQCLHTILQTTPHIYQHYLTPLARHHDCRSEKLHSVLPNSKFLDLLNARYGQYPHQCKHTNTYRGMPPLLPPQLCQYIILINTLASGYHVSLLNAKRLFLASICRYGTLNFNNSHLQSLHFQKCMSIVYVHSYSKLRTTSVMPHRLSLPYFKYPICNVLEFNTPMW